MVWGLNPDCKYQEWDLIQEKDYLMLTYKRYLTLCLRQGIWICVYDYFYILVKMFNEDKTQGQAVWSCLVNQLTLVIKLKSSLAITWDKENVVKKLSFNMQTKINDI